MRWTPRLLAASAALLALASAPAAGEEKRLVGLLVLPREDAEASTARVLQKQLLRALAKERSVLVVEPLHALADSPVSLEAETRSAMQRGYVAMEARDYRQATSYFTRALRRMNAALASTPKTQLADAQLHLAASYLGSGHADKAVRVLAHLLTWRNRHPMRLRLAPPRGWRGVTQRARQWVDDAPFGTVRVTSVPPAAEAFVDGRRLGATPTRATNLIAGTHYLTLKLEGYSRVVMPVQVTERGETVSVALRPEEPLYALVQDLRALRGEIGAQRVTFPALLRDQLGLSSALVVLVHSPRRVSAFLYRLKDGRLMTRLPRLGIRLPLPKKAIRRLALWRGPTVVEQREVDPGGGEEEAPPPTGTGTAWYRRWWVWGLVGAAVAAGVAIPLAVTQGGEAALPEERLRVSW